ncbi:MAG: glycosyltransferase [Chitinophagaceae bacterium]|jgi:glycosyltransferase involved in cell wall biosynthesis|nr:glycosyltransferase [Chitinophagaceae bacterium]
MRLAIISDCVHAQTHEGLTGSDVHIFVRQMEALSKYFSEVVICCPFIQYNSGLVLTTYSNTKVSFIPLQKVGGNTVKDKLQLLLQIPKWLSAFSKANRFSDIVYQRFPNNLNIPGFFYFYFARKKVFATYTGTWEKNNTESLSYTFQKWLLQNFFKGPIGVYSNNLNLVGNVFSSFSPSYSETEWNEEAEQVEHKVQLLKQQHSVPLTMVTVGSFIEYKNQQYILDACLILHQQNIDFHLYMVGDGKLMYQYKNFVQQNRLQNNITFTGKLNYNDVRKIYRKVNFVVQSPTVEGFGKVPIEGYFHGALPLINNISMSGYITQQNTLGYLFSVEDRMALVNLLKEISIQPSVVVERIQKSRLFVRQFTLEAWANQYYQQIKKYYPTLN